MYWLLLVLLSWLTSAVCAAGANIYVERPHDGVPLLIVDGDFVLGDDKVFNNLAIGLDQATVIFSSRGGLAAVGVSMGRTIAIKGFATAVLPNSVCASSCSLAWLSGRPRELFPSSKIGFHAIYTTDDGTNNVSSFGNALVGSYLRGLGLTDKAILYVTMAQPDSMIWLSPSDAEMIGLDVKVLVEASATSQDKSNPYLSPSIDTEQKENSGGAMSTVEIPAPGNGWRFLGNTDLMGFDISTKPIIVATPDDCRSECDRSTKCSAYTYNQAYKACFLKWGASVALQYTGAFSGYKGSNIVQRLGREYGSEIGFRTSKGTEITAMPYSTYMNKNLSWCQDDCVDDFQCEAFTYYRNGICLKFRESKPFQKNDTVFSGVKVR